MYYLVIDCNNLAWIQGYRLSDLSIETQKTGVIFGFIRSIFNLQKEFQPDGMIFCFDSKHSYRKLIYPGYKSNRSKLEPDQQEFKELVIQQIHQLRKEILPTMGFRNLLHQNGYEADDLIAEVVRFEDSFTVVSNDSDLLQLLSERIDIYNPRKKEILSKHIFEQEYNIPPSKWVEIKALTGDSSDNIPKLINGIGTKNAIKFIRGRLQGVVGKRLTDHLLTPEGHKQFELNKKLISIPFEGKKPIDIMLSMDQLSRSGFIDILDYYRMNSLLKDFSKWEQIFGL